MSATEVPEIVQLIFNMELLAISNMSEVRSEHKVCFGAFLRLKKGFEQQDNQLRSVTKADGARTVLHGSLHYS